MRILITGADGFLGARASEVLEAHGHEVIRVVRSPSGPGRRRHVMGDLVTATGWQPVLRGVDAILHLAGRAHVVTKRGSEAEDELWRTNADATRRLAEQAAQGGVRRLVYVSTIGVHGNVTQSKPFVETAELRPTNAYTRSKLEGERALRRVAMASSLEVVTVRPPLVYGPAAKGNFLRLLKLAASGVPLPLASLQNRRNLLGLDNLCDALLLCLESPAAAGETFLVAEPEAHSTPEIFATLYRVMNRPNRLFPFPASVLARSAKLAGVPELHEKLCGCLEADASKIRRLLSWRPHQPFTEGIRQTAVWYSQNR